MGTRIWWCNPPEEGVDREPDMVADKWQTYTLSFLMEAYFDFDPSSEWIDEPYFYKKEKWRELDQKLPMEVGPEGFQYPSHYCDGKGKKVFDGGFSTLTQDRFNSARPILRLIAQDERDVAES